MQGGRYEPSISVVGIEDIYQNYFSIFLGTNLENFGNTELIDPLSLWPLVEEFLNYSGTIDYTCP